MPENKQIEQITPTVEQPVAAKPEQITEQVAAKPEQITEQVAEVKTVPTTQVSPTVVSSQTKIEKDIEGILAKGLDNVFLSMDAGTQQEFKKKGEETSQAIVVLLQKAKLKVKKIINLIVSWLKIIPRVNKYYIEQEAKIKTEEILLKYKK